MKHFKHQGSGKVAEITVFALCVNLIKDEISKQIWSSKSHHSYETRRTLSTRGKQSENAKGDKKDPIW